MNTCFVDYRISDLELSNLYKENLNIIQIPKSPHLYDSINGHPDIQVNITSNSSIILASNSNLEISNIALKNISITYSKNKLVEKYPNNIFLNAVNLENYFIHNLKYTDEILLSKVQEKELINIKQGYSKCSCCIVSDNALITSDAGIYNSLKPYNIDVLFIPAGDISLPGLSYGFIGGSCGLISKDKLAFFGNLKNHSYEKEVKEFLFKHSVKPIYLCDTPLIDRGSILTLI
ncbi:DUF6873 family GME fold protein [uncultured Clostridium sp.]|jgi:hypothetical protein|uniref:DUF6873 family GME fold protein n=1 Tax=uncultured Clostridium sp. TaxID=59620 RepID=UPI0026193A2C|nr:hypothetical protein [uncultured Clostridium sp.]